MDANDLKFMRMAFDLASQCRPVEDTIPYVGAVIVADGEVIGQGHRGRNCTDDDKHAEFRAIESVSEANKPRLAGATLYTTLEPCTPESRSIGEQCCSELIYQKGFKRVLVGIMDPNREVTGKGLLRLQESKVEVGLFPYDLSLQIQGLNSNFIRAQQTWGAKIISPVEDAYLRTYEKAGRQAVQFTCLNPPTSSSYLFVSRGGQFSPMPGPFRFVKGKTWEIDAFFGTTGHHVLNLVTANNLGSVLIRYYWKIVEQRIRQRDALQGKVDSELISEIYPAIEMNGLPKGLRLEDSVPVFVGSNIKLLSTAVEPVKVQRGKPVTITYEIECAVAVANGPWLGASFTDNDSKKLFAQSNEDKRVSLKKGHNTCQRIFTIPNDAPEGKQMLRTNVWFQHSENKSQMVAVVSPTEITILP